MAHHDGDDRIRHAAPTAAHAWRLWAALGALWLGAVVAGLAMAGGATTTRPASRRARRRAGRPTSRLARDATPADARDARAPALHLHPRQPRRAGRADGARAAQRPQAYVVFMQARRRRASELGAAPISGRRAARIPGVDGRCATTTGARRGGSARETSGQTFLYDADGALLFSGGTTGARGHAGDNAGRATLLALLDEQDARHALDSPVFGCSLFAAGRSHAGRRRDEATHAPRELTLPTTALDAGRRRPSRSAAEALFHAHQHADLPPHRPDVRVPDGRCSGSPASSSRSGCRRCAWSGSASQTHVHVWAAVVPRRRDQPVPGRCSRCPAARRRGRRATRSPPRRC